MSGIGNLINASKTSNAANALVKLGGPKRKNTRKSRKNNRKTTRKNNRRRSTRRR